MYVYICSQITAASDWPRLFLHPRCFCLVLDYPVKISSQPNESNSLDNVKTVLDIARQVTSKVCAVNVLTETTEDLVDDCAIPLFDEKPL